MKKPYLFIDRDGTLIEEPADQQIDSLEKLIFVPGMISGLRRIAKELNFALVMVSNQDGLGTNSFPEETFWPAQNLLLNTLRGEGIEFENILIDRSFPADNSPGRKPGTKMLEQYINAGSQCDMRKSFVIGDRLTDLELAKNLGCRSIFLSNESNPLAALSTRSWEEIYWRLRASQSCAEITRTTKETSIECRLAIYGKGQIEVASGIGFLDHMLTLLAFHAGFDLNLQAQGDLQVDEHHTIEDVALVLGRALARALQDKRGIERYGFSLPMDEARADVLLDFSGRAKLVWDVKFKREKIGEFPSEMFKHFFESLAQEARIALHIVVEGENEHHKAEAAFKGVGRALRAALAPSTQATAIPSSKGVL